MKNMICILLLSALTWSSAWAAAGQAKARPAESKQAKAAPQGDPVAGKEKADAERCMECHGVDGQGAGHANSAEGKFAKLAGQYPAYVLKQIRDFRSGARKHDQMAIMARSVADEDVIDIAAYFSSQAVMNGQGASQSELGRALYHGGDSARGIPACVSCHGVEGRGTVAPSLVPHLAGQEWRYLDKQLRDWRAGERRNSADGVMNAATKALTDKEIEALADYLSGL